jgi:hypothetical protein
MNVMEKQDLLLLKHTIVKVPEYTPGPPILKVYTIKAIVPAITPLL